MALMPALSMHAQITLNRHNTTIGAVIKLIQKQSKYRFFYDDEIAKSRVDHIKLQNASINDAMAQLFKGKNIDYNVADKVVYLKRKPAPEPKRTVTPQQQPKRKITGHIVDENGEPLIGATVKVKDGQGMAVTDIDGNYTIESTENNPVLVYDYLGYKQQVVNADHRGVVNVNMVADTHALGEVVVTALGIEREKKMLGYAVQEVKSSDLNVTGDPSVTSALDGKVAGLQMNLSSTGLGGSTKITIRGNSSLTDNNQPLWIVDGVPFTDNETSSASAYGGYDRGGTNFDINPEDIESISVLKGPNAAALYGSRAGNGVILVTTKKGASKKGFGISYSGNFTWSSVATTLPMQKTYGQGNQGKPIYITDDEGNRHLTGELSFGGLLDGHNEPSFLGQDIPYIYYGDKLKDYFQTGFSHSHTVAIGNQTEKSNYRLSVGYNGNQGIFDKESLDKLTIDLNTGTVINDHLSLDGKVSLSNTKAKNRPMTGLNGEVAQLLLIPGNVRLEDLQQYSTATRLHQNWFGPDQQYSNPYYVRHRYQNSDERWRAFGYYAATLTFTPWLKGVAKYAFDYYRTRIQATDLSLGSDAISDANATWQSKVTTDNMSRDEENHFEQNLSLMLIGDHQIGEDFRLGYNLGYNYMYQKYELLDAGVENMLVKDSWLFNTGARLATAGDSGHKRAMYSVFGSASLAYKEYLSLDLTARNDWSSTLPSSNRSFFYPSASLSYIFTDFMHSICKPLPKWVTFAKLRLSAAQVGKDPEPYNLYNTRKFHFAAGQREPLMQTIKMNADLKPEIKTSYEVGLDMKFLDNRLGFDFTYYNMTTKNQAMLVDASAPWTQQWINAGKIKNAGVELMIYGSPVKTKDFNFDLNVNLAHNKSTVESLADGVSRVYFNGDSNMPVKVGAVRGGKLGDIFANNLMKRDAQGRVVVDANGLPMPETGNGNLEQYLLDHPIGNIQPDLLMSVTPTFRYKNLSLTAMFDMKFGGDIVSVSEGMATAVGTSQRTEERGTWQTVNGVEDFYLVVPGVKQDGSVNDIPVSAQSYYSNIGLYKSQKGYAEEFVHDASYIKLKEISLGYSLPQSLLKRTPLTSLRLSFVARNLCYLMKHCKGNPGGGYDTTMFSQAIDFAAVPYTRTFGFSLNLGF